MQRVLTKFSIIYGQRVIWKVRKYQKKKNKPHYGIYCFSFFANKIAGYEMFFPLKLKCIHKSCLLKKHLFLVYVIVWIDWVAISSHEIPANSTLQLLHSVVWKQMQIVLQTAI